MLDAMLTGAHLFERIFDQLQEEERRKHEQKLQELSIIADSNMRDQFAAELLLDRVLAPIERAQFQIQDAAKHAQYMAEAIGYHYQDHGLTQEQATKLCTQFRLLAVKLTESNSLQSLKLIYKATTLFSDQVSVFKHREKKYSIERGIRDGILNRLNTCIANYENFQRRSGLFACTQDKKLNTDQSRKSLPLEQVL